MPKISRNFMKKFLRDIEKSKILLLSLILLTVLGVSSYVSFMLGYQSIETSCQDFYASTSFHDVEIQTPDGNWVNQSRIENISSSFRMLHPEVIAINHRLIVESGYNVQTQSKIIHGSGRVIGFDTNITENQRIDKLHINSGRSFTTGESYENKVVIEAKFADQLNLTVGDSFSINLGNFKEFEVIGTVYSPEYVVHIPSRFGSIFPRTRYGIFFLPISEVQESLQVDGLINNIVLTFTEGNSLETKNNLIKDYCDMIEQSLGINLLDPVTQQFQISNWFLKLNIEGFKDISELLPLLILVVAALSIFITLNRFIDSQKQHIGVALSLGYSVYDLLFNYLILLVIIGAIGGIIGIVTGIFISNVMAQLYIAKISLPSVKIASNYTVILLGFFLGFITSLTGGFLPVWKVSHMVPKDAMKRFKVNSLTKRSFSWKVISFFSIKTSLKLPIKNIFRNPWRTSTNILGISGAVVILVISLTLFNSASTSLNSEFNTISNYDLEITYKTPKLGELGLYDDLDKINNISLEYGIESYDCVLEIPVLFSTTDSNKANEGVIIAYNSSKPSTHRFKWDNRFSDEWKNSDSSIVLTSGLVNYFQLSPQNGIDVRITHPRLPITSQEEQWLRWYSEQNGKNNTLIFLEDQFQQNKQKFSYNQTENFILKNTTLSIGGVSKEIWGTINYVSLNRMSEMLGFGIFKDLGIDLTPVSKIYIQLNSSGRKLQSELTSKILADFDNVQSVLFKEEINEGIVEFMSLFFTLIIAMIGISFLILISTVITTILLNIHERKRELMTMRVIGMTNREIMFNIIGLEYVMISLISFGIGFPIGLFITEMIIDNLLPVMVYFDISVNFLIPIIILCLTLSSTLLAEYPAMRTVFKQDLMIETKEFID